MFTEFVKFYVPDGANGASGVGFFNGHIWSVAAWVAALAEKMPGFLVFSVNNDNVFEMCSDLVFEM